MTRSSLALLVLFGFANVGLADNWPAWRGPRGDGHCQEKALPMKWTSTDNVRWRIPLPAPGNKVRLEKVANLNARPKAHPQLVIEEVLDRTETPAPQGAHVCSLVDRSDHSGHGTGVAVPK